MPAQASSPWPDADLALLQGIYELQCTARMNAHYYEARLGRLQTIAFWMEATTAATASGSGIFALLEGSSWGQPGWQALAVAAALVAVVKPIYAPGKRIEIFTRQQQGYHTNFFNLKKLAFSIRQEGAVNGEHRRRYDTFFDRHVQLSTEDESAPNRRLLQQAKRLTEAECPPESFWWPAGGAEAAHGPAPTATAEDPPATDRPPETPPEAAPLREAGGEIVQLKPA